MSSPPDPAVQLRQALTVSKRQGVPFDAAWKYAYGNLSGPHDTGHRRQWRDVLADLRWAFERAYLDQDVPGGAALQRLAEALALDAESDREIKPVRTPPEMANPSKKANPSGARFVPAFREAAA